MIKIGGFPFKVFLTLYESCVHLISDYEGEVFGYEKMDSSFKLHVRAARAFLDVSKFSTISGIISEFNTLLPQFRCQLKMIRYYHRLLNLSSKVTARIVFIWDRTLNSNWGSEVKSIFSDFHTSK